MDLAHWQTEDKFTLDEIASLIVGVDPLAKSFPFPPELEGKRALVERQLERDYRSEVSRLRIAVSEHYHPDDEAKNRTGSIAWMTKGNDGIRSSNYNLARADVLEDTIFHILDNASDVEDLCFPVSEQKFSREEVARWCMVRGWKSQFAFHELGSNAAWHETDDLDPSKKPAALLASETQQDQVRTRAANNYVTLIAAMAIKHYQYDPTESKSTVPARLELLMSQYGCELSAQTIRGYLAQGSARIGSK